MNQFLTSLFILCFCFLSYADFDLDDYEDRRSRVNGGYSTIEFATIETLECIANLVKFRDGVTESFKIASELIDIKEDSKVYGLKKDCKNKLSVIRSNPNSLVTDRKFLQKHGKLQDYSVNTLVMLLYRPKITCELLSAHIGAGFGLGLGAEAGAGYCFSSSGKRWLQIKAGLSLPTNELNNDFNDPATPFSLGAVAAIGFEKNNNVIECSNEYCGEILSAPDDSMVYLSSDYEHMLAVGIGGANYVDLRDRPTFEDNIKCVYDDCPSYVEGVGIGFGQFRAVSNELNLKLLPLPADRGKILEVLKESRYLRVFN